ncbi:MAG: STAS domain-containing protein [Bacteroidetes bacterium]|nr:STAS domain-containing protein [Bacteroidota bacterium]MBM3417808.1 STAS domain-containing protein [Bacteroidota bacterium]
MNFSISTHGSAIVVHSHVAKLDSTNAPDLKSLFVLHNKNGVNQIVFEMAETLYCDSSGLSAILVANRLCKDTNGSFVLCGLQSAVRKMVEIAQLDRVLSIENTVDEALSHMNP